MRTSGSWAKSNDRVLVISDSEEMRGLTAGVLGSAGFVVFDQPSAIGATRTIRDNEIRAVVADIAAPGMRGEKLLSVLRENPRLAGLVLVVITEGTEHGDAGDFAAADAAITKSSVESRLAPLLGSLLRKSSFHPHTASPTNRS